MTQTLTFGVNPYDLATNQTGRYHVIDPKGFIRAKTTYGFTALDYAGKLSDAEPGEFQAIDTRDGSEYGVYLAGEIIR